MSNENETNAITTNGICDVKNNSIGFKKVKYYIHPIGTSDK